MAAIMKRTAGITAALLVLFALLYHIHSRGIFLSLAITAGTIFYHFAMRLLVGAIFDRTMKNRADYHRRWYQPCPWEPWLYEKLHVKRWKGRMPTYDPTAFNPRQHTWDEIAQAMCQSELVHETNAVLSFLPLLVVPLFGALPVFLITSILAAALDVSFIILQRYNRPRIIKIAYYQAREKV